jgi:hypothetical protein
VNRRARIRLSARLLATLAVAVPLAVSARAADLSPAEATKLHDYMLSMDKVKAMQAATDDYTEAAKADASLDAERKTMSGETTTLTEAIAHLAAHPRILAFYAKRGLGAEDAVMLPLAVGYADIALHWWRGPERTADRTSPAQIAFFKAHEPELKAQAWLYGKDPDDDPHD